MAVTSYISLLTGFEETVGQGIGPNGTTGGTVSTGAEWETAEAGGTAFQIPHIPSSLSFESLERTVIEAERTKARVFTTDPRVPGLSNAELSFQSYLTGRGSALAAGVLATQTPLSRTLLNCLGGVHYAETCTLAAGGHTTTVVNVDDASTLAVGAIVAPLDPTTGLAHPRRITDVTALAVTLDRELPFTPADGNLVLGGATLFIDEDVICDTASNLGSTMSLVGQKGQNGAAGFEMNGCKLGLSSMSFERNGFATLDLSLMAARFTDPSSGPDPTLPDAVFPNPLAIGPDTQLAIANIGVTTNTLVCNGAMTVEAGVPVVPIPCMTARTGNMEGYAGYTIEPGDTLVDLDLYPYATSWFADYDNEQLKNVSVSRLGASGNIFSVHFPQCEILNTPKQLNADNILRSGVQFRAQEVTGATTALARSKFVIFLG